MLFMTSVSGLHAAVKAAKPPQRMLSIAMRDEKARKRHAEAKNSGKKKARQVATRLPTERLATACWDISIFKRTAWEPASLLDFCSLQRSDREMLCTAYPQLVIRSLGS
jgi:hypothetical protein